MSVNGVGKVGYGSVLSTSSPRQAQGAGDLPSAGEPSSEISGPGKWMRALADLQAGDPARFKQTAAAAAEALTQKAASAGAEDARLLQGLADQFSQASQSGDLSALRPPGGRPPPVPPPEGGERSGGESPAVKKYAAQQEEAGQSALRATIDATVQQVLQTTGPSTAAVTTRSSLHSPA